MVQNFLVYLGLTFVGVVGIYMVARLVTAAYYRSRADYESRWKKEK